VFVGPIQAGLVSGCYGRGAGQKAGTMGAVSVRSGYLILRGERSKEDPLWLGGAYEAMLET
jgi:hypothetical protein